MADTEETFATRLAAVQARMQRACARAGRDVGEVLLLAVSKNMSPERVREAADAGLTSFGESRVQEARQKIPLCPARLSWHFVGHLQTNKARDAVELFEMIHSVDSERVLDALERACEAAGRSIRACLEVNVSGESSKYGVSPEQLPALLSAADRFFRVTVVGLMTIPPLRPDPEEARPFFRRLRELRDRAAAETGRPLPELSMGMSGDFEVAIEEGTTCIRVGTALFGARKVAAHG